ncbi:hypothetical protein BDV24DRAFT_174904 [Aspergillus arachidicola]|uniref:Uncharacterized protein n=1 Tax=Aspergillus arachidicola TaxID=656916 RepID=A0A5N6Y716_9EURO|nr:hypothetical protein BDV24DRAFT_174904 [Aspergillus arachidicola]
MWQKVFGHSHIGHSGMPQYTYRPLTKGSNKIRLVRLLPHEDKAARVECELIEYTLTDSTGQHPYEALSYVLQEVALARDITVMCGHVEINGYAFVSGLQRLEVLRTAQPELQGLVQSAYHLIKGAVFRPSYRFNTRGTLSIGELIDMYHTRHASCLHDKVYALLGMCSDDPDIEALRPDYHLPWNKVYERVIRYIISPDISVKTWPDREAAVIRGKGYMLGIIKSVITPGSRYDKQEVKVLFRDTVEALYYYMTSGVQWLLQTPAEPIRAGDIVCLLQGASAPSIVRISNKGLRIIMASVIPRHRNMYGDMERVPDGLPSEASVLHDLVLQWDWAPTLDNLKANDQATVPRKPHNSQFSTSRPQNENDLFGSTAVLHDILTIAVPSKYIVLTSDFRGIGRAPDGASVMKALLNQAGDILPITEDIVRRAADHHDLGADLLEILFEHKGNELPITEQVVRAAARNPHGHDVMELLFKQRGDDLPITEEVIMLVAGNTERGLTTLEILFNKRGENLAITESIVVAAAGNCTKGPSMIKFLFEQRGESLPITEAVLIAAAKNPGLDAASLILARILKNRGERLPLTEGVIEAVAANSSHIRASTLLQLLGEKDDRAFDLSVLQLLFQNLKEKV